MSVLSWHGPLCGVRATSCSFCITTLSHPPEVKEKCPEREDQQILPMKIEFSRQLIIRQMASKTNGETPDAWRSQTIAATSTQRWGKRLTISSVGRPGGDV